MKKILNNTYAHFMHDSMHRNSSLLIISQAVAAGCAFLFWVINARLFSAQQVGLATAFISYGMLVATFTNLGLPNTIIRFLPTSKYRGGLFTASLILVAICSIIGGILAVILAKHLVPKLSIVHSSTALSMILILLIFGIAVSALLDGTFMAFRKGEYILKKALITNLPRVALPFIVVTTGVKGMTGIYALTILLGVGYNLYIIFNKIFKLVRLRPILAEVVKHRPYAASNYFGGLFGVLPSTLVPIIVLNALGAASAAYFYMPLMIAAFLSVIPGSVSQALIAECAQTNDASSHRLLLKKALKHQYQILIPIVILLLAIGWPILLVFGRDYALYGYVPLCILVLSSLVLGLNWLGDTWMNIQKRSRDYLVINAFNAAAVIIFVYLLASHGLVGAAFGWFSGQLLTALLYVFILTRRQPTVFNESVKTS